MQSLLLRVRDAALRVDETLTRRCRLLGALLALAIAALFAAVSVVAGPLYNLNDIGTFRLRALFIVMTAGVLGCALLAATLLHRGRFSRLALRQMILTAGMMILLQAINQKTYAYVEVIQPLVRAMDAQGLAAIVGWETNLSAPALTLLYLVTRLPVYDMYVVKLLSVAGFLALCVLALYVCDRRNMGIRAEVALALCLILPQGFLNAACAAQMDVAAVALLAASLVLALHDGGGKRALASAVCYGAAVALSGFALYALPVFIWLMGAKKIRPAHLAIALAVVALMCLPALVSGMPLGETAGSLVRANFALPQYASGAPNVLSFIPRALPEEMPEYAMLRHVAQMDTETYAQPFYTQAHFEQVSGGVILAALALLMGLCAMIVRQKGMGDIARAFALTLAALLCCPGVTSGAWVLLDVLAIVAIVAEPKLRLPACLTLFATAGASCYPVAEEILLPMIAAMILCLLALAIVMGMFEQKGGNVDG